MDALAKLAAGTREAPPAVVRLLESDRAAVKHAAALLGAVTYAANNCVLPVQNEDGSWGSKIARDAQPPPGRGIKRQRSPAEAPAPPAPDSASRMAALLSSASRNFIAVGCQLSAEGAAPPQLDCGPGGELRSMSKPNGESLSLQPAQRRRDPDPQGASALKLSRSVSKRVSP